MKNLFAVMMAVVVLGFTGSVALAGECPAGEKEVKEKTTIDLGIFKWERETTSCQKP